MIGDSFGVPNWYGPPGIAPELHVEFLLKEMKYDVINLSQNGSTNDQHHAQLEIFFASNPTKQVDYIVWFHNAAMSFIPPPVFEFKMNDFMKEKLLATYKDMQAIKSKQSSKWVVIGGSSPIPDFFYPFNIHDYIIPDWRAKILKENLPQVFGLGVTQNRILVNSELNTESTEIKNKTIDDFEYIQGLISNNKALFPDGGHPGAKPHLDLAKELDAYFGSS